MHQQIPAKASHMTRAMGVATPGVFRSLLFPANAKAGGHHRIYAHPGAHRQGDHQQLKGIDDGQGRQAGVGILAHEQAVHNVVKGLNQLGQHHRRGQPQQDLAHLFCAEQLRKLHKNAPRPFCDISVDGIIAEGAGLSIGFVHLAGSRMEVKVT